MTLTLVALILGALMSAPEPKPAATVLFVCEHGSAKSVVAAAHFNQARSPVEQWEVPPVSTEYAASREAMLLRIERLLQELPGLGSR